MKAFYHINSTANISLNVQALFVIKTTKNKLERTGTELYSTCHFTPLLLVSFLGKHSSQ
jgi:hypothetical protein